MKKIIVFLTGAALLLAGCAKVQNDDVVPENGKRTVSLNAAIDNADTRISVTINGQEARYSWQEDDEILVMTVYTGGDSPIYGSTYATVTSGSIGQDGATARFDIDLDEGYELGKYAFYPDNGQCWDFEDHVEFGLYDSYQYKEGVTNMPMLGTITSTGARFRAVGGLLMVTIDNIPSNAHNLHFSVPGKKIVGSFTVIGSSSQPRIDAEELDEDEFVEMDGNSIDIYWYDDEGGDPEGGEPGGGEGTGSGISKTFYIPLPCGKYNNMTFSICEYPGEPLFTRVARMDNNGDGICGDDEGIEIGRNQIVMAPTLSFAWDQNVPKTLSINMEQYEDDLDENGVLNVDQYDDAIEFEVTLKGKYPRELDEFDVDDLICELVNVNDQTSSRIVITDDDIEYSQDYEDYFNTIVVRLNIPTANVGEYKLAVSYGALAPVESFNVKVYPVVPIPAALGEYWEYRYNYSYVYKSAWFEPYWNKDSDGNVYLKTRVAASRSEALPDYAFRGSFTDEDKGGSFDAFEYFTQITSIPTNAFWGCTYLTGITFPSGVTSIGTYAFRYCESLTEIELPAGLTSIGNYAFADCYQMTSMELPSGVTSIGDFSFNSSWRLESINLENVSSIGKNAFAGCDALTEIVIGDATIDSNAFHGCDELNRVTIGTAEPNSSATIGAEAFSECEQLSEVNLISVSSIGNNAFAWCSLQSITLSDNLTSIGNDVFWGSGLRTITIPASVTSIGNSAFAYCNSLEYIVFEGANPPQVSDIESWFWLDAGTSNCKIYVPSTEAVEAYQAAWPAISGRIEVKPANL